MAGAVIGLLLALLGFALVVQVKSNTADTQLDNARQDDLVRILSDLNSRDQRLRARSAPWRSTLSQLGAGAAGREAALAEARRRADELGILAGTLAAQGEGLRIRLVPRKQPIRGLDGARGDGGAAGRRGGGDADRRLDRQPGTDRRLHIVRGRRRRHQRRWPRSPARRRSP